MARGALIAVGVVLAGCLSACDAGSGDLTASGAPSSVATGPDSPATAAKQETSEGCIDGTAAADGTQGLARGRLLSIEAASEIALALPNAHQLKE